MRARERRRWDPVLPRIAGVALAIFAALDIVLAFQLATGTVTWDVKGHLLAGTQLLLFIVIVSGVGVLGLLAGALIWRGRHPGRVAAVAFWLVAGTVAAVVDRSYPGPGNPLWMYALFMALGPAAVTYGLLWLPGPSRRFFDI